ncbi:hypothetical protein PHAMO_360023 [Magnetospirillum molischianum DSM 120]|uniref:OmpR/PhoB-type domain-containing protein n=1 Tax=Magnetospirillum molischianum DSM 120 TaxID=1150626 RepID=H8FVC5_MAGML|nr:hypothetical protein PHAMO_360023 [Magnetospirillum molischianum DSM 120]
MIVKAAGQFCAGELSISPSPNSRWFWPWPARPAAMSAFDSYTMPVGAGPRVGAGLDGYRVNVRAAIKRIRGKFRDLDPAFDRIVAYPGFGYSWRVDHG